MPGRHDAQPDVPRRWFPTAVDAVIAVTPFTSMLTALGLAGGGYLTGREGVAACGAVVGAVGLAVERRNSARARVRLRRERSRHRESLRQVGLDIAELQRQMTGLRADLEGVVAERDAMSDGLSVALAELTAARREARPVRLDGLEPARPAAVAASGAPAPAVQAPALARTLVHEAPELPGVAEPLPAFAAADGNLPNPLFEPVVRPAAEHGGLLTPIDHAALLEAARPRTASPVESARPEVVVSAPAAGTTGLLPAAPGGPVTGSVRIVDVRTPVTPQLVVPGQLRSPVATGGIPLAGPPSSDTEVFAALADGEVDELTRVLERPAERSSILHTGHPHRAGDFAREDTDPHGVPVLYVAGTGTRVA